MKSKVVLVVFAFAIITTLESCYSFSGVSTDANTIQIEPFFNNTDLGPANLGPNFTNRMKDYFQTNSALSVVSEDGELYIEGVITDYRLSPVAPVSSGNTTLPDAAAATRLTITFKISYVDNKVPTNSFKDKTFSWYDDFTANQDFTAEQERMEKNIFNRVLQDIFTATIANW